MQVIDPVMMSNVIIALTVGSYLVLGLATGIVLGSRTLVVCAVAPSLVLLS